MKCPECDGALIADKEGMYVCHNCFMEKRDYKFTKDEAVYE